MPLTADGVKWQLFESPGSPGPQCFAKMNWGST